MAAEESLSYDNLVGSLPTREFRISLTDAEVIVRGQVMAYNTSTNKLTSYESTGTNGKNVVYGIAAEASGSGTGRFLSVFILGEFNLNALVFSFTGDDPATQAFINAAREKGLILKPFMA